jgi:catechol 2,3-dioxygenase-like lactoylglutathione lyase family enzyme
LRELCELGGSTGVGFDAMYAGPTGRDADVTFFSRLAPRGPELTRRVAEALDGPFDVITSRHWFEHLDDPYEFLVDLREQAAGRPVVMYVEVPDACYDLATAGWEVIYPHVSYFDESSLARVFERAGWKVERSGTLFSGMFRFIEASVNRPEGPHNTVDSDTVDRQLRAIGGFAARHFGERERWRRRIAELDEDGAHPVMWGAGSRGVQFLNFADPIGVLGAVVDVNPRKWSRYLPGTGHRVDPPATLTELKTRAVIITNPAYRAEIAADLIDLGVSAEILVA